MSCSLYTKPSSFLNLNFPKCSLSSLLGQTIPQSDQLRFSIVMMHESAVFQEIVTMYENFIHLPLSLPRYKSHFDPVFDYP